MHDQPKYIPLRESSFFGDVRSARPLVEGTVARGHLHDDTLLYSGKIGKADATVFPVVVGSANVQVVGDVEVSSGGEVFPVAGNG